MNKVKGTENPADMNTKGLSGDEIAKYIKMLGMGYKEGRSELAPEVHNLIKKLKCTRYNSTSSKITHRVRTNNATTNESKVLDSNSQLQVSESSGCMNCTCNCTGCWLFCDENPRA